MKTVFREVALRDLITWGVLPVIVIALMWPLAVFLLVGELELNSAAVYTVASVLTYFLTERFSVGLVLFYKAFAPMKLRDKCRFEPTCSTYMIMAIRKYGLIIGLVKGIRRLCRCKPPNGGEDYP